MLSCAYLLIVLCVCVCVYAADSDTASALSMDNPEQFESKKQRKETMEHGIKLWVLSLSPPPSLSLSSLLTQTDCHSPVFHQSLRKASSFSRRRICWERVLKRLLNSSIAMWDWTGQPWVTTWERETSKTLLIIAHEPIYNSAVREWQYKFGMRSTCTHVWWHYFTGVVHYANILGLYCKHLVLQLIWKQKLDPCYDSQSRTGTCI